MEKIFLDNILSKEKIDGVIHFAASSQVGESMKICRFRTERENIYLYLEMIMTQRMEPV